MEASPWVRILPRRLQGKCSKPSTCPQFSRGRATGKPTRPSIPACPPCSVPKVAPRPALDTASGEGASKRRRWRCFPKPQPHGIERRWRISAACLAACSPSPWPLGRGEKEKDQDRPPTFSQLCGRAAGQGGQTGLGSGQRTLCTAVAAGARATQGTPAARFNLSQPTKPNASRAPCRP